MAVSRSLGPKRSFIVSILIVALAVVGGGGGALAVVSPEAAVQEEFEETHRQLVEQWGLVVRATSGGEKADALLELENGITESIERFDGISVSPCLEPWLSVARASFEALADAVAAYRDTGSTAGFRGIDELVTVGRSRVLIEALCA